MKRLLLLTYGTFLCLGAMWSSTMFAYANTPPIDNSYNSRIIDDSTFDNTGAMSVTDIQNFLNSKVPVCDTNHAGGDPSQPPPYTCLKDYVDPTTGKSAAQLIYDESTSIGLNPQVVLVTLQKEQGLITDTWPYPSQYKSAMGYGCPESQSICDAQYYGFYNQVHLGARLLRAGQARSCGDTSTLPTWNDIPTELKLGHITNPSISPNRVDGVATYIGTCATGSLYNYTPHRPDSAYTLRNGSYYYGNYNFISYFTSWFGPTTSAYLARGTQSPNVYLVNLNNKYLVGNQDLLNVFGFEFGAVRTVDQGFMDALSPNPPVSRLGKDPNSGAVYLLEAGMKLQFNTCSQVSDYGFDCANALALPSAVLDGFLTGPNLSDQVKDSSGTVYQVVGGSKHYIPDMATWTASGLMSHPLLQLSDAFVASLPNGAPVLRDSVATINTDTGEIAIYIGSNLRNVPNMGVYNDWNFAALPTYRFSAALLNQIPHAASIGHFATASDSTKYILDHGTKHPVGAAASQWASSYPTSLSDALLNAVPTGPTLGTNVVGDSSGAVYQISSAQKRYVPSIPDLVALGLTSATLTPMEDDTLATIPSGPLALGSLHLIKAAGNALITMVDGSSGWKIPSPDVAAAFGLDLSQTSTVDAATLAAYPASSYLGLLVTDGTSNYAMQSGAKHSISSQMATNYGYTSGSFQTLSTSAIANLASGTALTQFIKTAGSAQIFYVQSGQRRAVQSGQTYTTLGGQGNTLTVSDAFLQSIPVGSPLP